MTTFSTNFRTNDISSIAGDLVASSQVSFSLAPHCSVVPVTAEDITNKAYVDTRLVNSGSGTNLYFNYSVVDAILPNKQLGTSIITPSTSTMISTPQLGTNAVASFITDLGYPGNVTIPAGIYELNQFGRQNGGSGGVCRYFFTLVKRTSAGVESILGTSGFSADINTSVTDIFFAQLPLGATSVLSTDRLIVNIFTLGTLTTVGATIESFYQSLQYSYITTPLVSGSNFLSLNNTFTGANSFTQLVTMSGTMPVVTTTASTSAPSITFVSDCIANRLIPYLTTALGVALAGTQTITGSKTFTPNVTLNGTMPVATTTTSTTAPSITFVSACIANRLIPYLPTALGVTLANAQTITGNKTFDDGLTLGVGKNITLSSGTVAPVAGQLGYIIPNILATTTALINATDTTILTQSLAAGTWLLNYQFRTNVTTAGTTGIFSIRIISGGKTLGGQTSYSSEPAALNNNSTRTGSVVVNFLIATNVSLQYYVSTTAITTILGNSTNPNDNTYLQCTKIA